MKGKKSLLLLILMVGIIALLIVGCGGSDKGTGQTEENSGSSSKVQEQEVSTEPIVIGIADSFSGALESFAKKTERGFKLGLEYATGGTMEVNGRPIKVIKEDTETNPEVAVQKAMKLLTQDKVDFLVGSTSSADSLAMQPLAEEFKTPFIVAQAIADSITGEAWNRYTFRTARNNSQDAVTWALSLGKPGNKIAFLGEDYAMGREGIAAVKEGLKGSGAEIVYEEYAPSDTPDFTPYIQKIIASDPDFVAPYWAGANTPWFQLVEMLAPTDIKMSVGVLDIDTHLALYKDITDMMQNAFAIYYYDFNDNEINDWLVKEYNVRYGMPPSYGDNCGFTAALAIVEALKKTGGNTDPEKIISAMEGMTFDTAKGEMTIRAEDHQTLQEMYVVDLKKVEGVDWAVPVATQVLSAKKTAPPIKNQR